MCKVSSPAGIWPAAVLLALQWPGRHDNFGGGGASKIGGGSGGPAGAAVGAGLLETGWAPRNPAASGLEAITRRLPEGAARAGPAMRMMMAAVMKRMRT